MTRCTTTHPPQLSTTSSALYNAVQQCEDTIRQGCQASPGTPRTAKSGLCSPRQASTALCSAAIFVTSPCGYPGHARRSGRRSWCGPPATRAAARPRRLRLCGEHVGVSAQPLQLLRREPRLKHHRADERADRNNAPVGRGGPGSVGGVAERRGGQGRRGHMEGKGGEGTECRSR